MPAYDRKPRLTELTFTFVPFTILFCAAMLLPELADDITLMRTLYTIRAATVMSIPALCLFALGPQIYERHRYWLLCWTFGFILYFFHFLYAVFGMFDGEIAAIYRDQGALIATNNFVLTFWWLFDVCLAWFARSEKRWIEIQRIFVHLLLFANFLISELTREGMARNLGILTAVCVVLCLALRLWQWLGGKHAAPA